MKRVVSFSLSERGLGHASRLVAVHMALRELGWDSLFLVERHQRLIADYGFRQVVVPHEEDDLISEPCTSKPSGTARLSDIASS